MSQSYNPISSPLNIPARLKSHKLQHTKHRPPTLTDNQLMPTPSIQPQDLKSSDSLQIFSYLNLRIESLSII